MLTNAEISSLKNRVKKNLDEALLYGDFDMSWAKCLDFVYDILFSKVGYTKSRKIPTLNDFTSLFGEYFDASAVAVDGNTATVTTPYSVFAFETGKNDIRLTCSCGTRFTRIATYFEPGEVLGFIGDSGIAAAAVEPVWKKYEPKLKEMKRVSGIESKYSSEFSDLKDQYSFALYKGAPLSDIEKKIQEAEARMRSELGRGAGNQSMLETIRRDAERRTEERRKSEERSRHIQEALQRKKEEREARHKDYADEIEALLGIRPEIRHRVPFTGGRHYDAYTYLLPNGQSVTFRYIAEDFKAILKDAEALIPVLRTLSELSATKLKINACPGWNYSPATPAMLRYWADSAVEHLDGFPAIKEMVERFRGEKVSFHVKPRNVEMRYYFRKGQSGFFSASLEKKAADESVAAFSEAVAALAVADSSRRKGRNLEYSIV